MDGKTVFVICILYLREMNLYQKVINIKYWFLSQSDLHELDSIYKKDSAKEEISVFKIFTISGNLLPVLIALMMTFLLKNSKDFKELDFSEVIKLINNGSLPLICYSIILSSVIFLLDKTDPHYQGMRKKILGIAVLLLFLSVSLYTLLTSLSASIGNIGHLGVFVFSIILFVNTISITKLMILLQQKVIKPFDKTVEESREEVRAVNNNPDPLFGEA